MNYTESLAYIHGINKTFCNPGLDRTRELCRLLGSPEKNLKFVHVAGTNGKGSFCAMLSSILRKAGYRVGLYTSPHMIRFNERMQVDGQQITDEKLAEITTHIQPLADGMQDTPTEFELVTAIAFAYFKQMQCDVVVLETGLGGRLDSTNVIESPIASVITGIGLDHTAILGDTYAKIAYEKGGIIKENCPVVIGPCNDEARTVLLDKVGECRSASYATEVNKISNVRYSLDGTVFSYKEMKDIQLSLVGVYQPKNCATVLECVHVLQDSGYDISEGAIRSGLAETRWIGRFEVLSKKPLVIYDGGHNPEGVKAFSDSLLTVLGDQKVCLVCGVLKDKDYAHMAREFARVADAVFTLTVDSPRALPAENLACLLKENGIRATACESAEEAVKRAFSYAKAKNIPLVLNGSLYMYCQVIDTIQSLL